MEANIKMIVGLGNPGPEYAETRHNAGYMLIDRVLSRAGRPIRQGHRCESRLLHLRYAGSSLILAKPETFMNLSGRAVRGLQKGFALLPEEIMVVYDCLDLPLGRIRLRPAGSSGGHKGMESIIQAVGSSAIPRLRIGIGREAGSGVVDHVLSTWQPAEVELLGRVLARAGEAALCAVREGVAKAMNRYNSELVQAGAPVKPDEDISNR